MISLGLLLVTGLRPVRERSCRHRPRTATGNGNPAQNYLLCATSLLTTEPIPVAQNGGSARGYLANSTVASVPAIVGIRSRMASTSCIFIQAMLNRQHPLLPLTERVRHRPRPTGSASSTTCSCRCLCLVKAQTDYTLPSVVPDVARIGIDHGEEDANVLPVLLHRPIRCSARRESVALVRPAQPVVVGAALSSSANGEPFAIDVEGEQHRPGPSLCSAVHSWNGGGTVAVTARAPVHKSQHPRPPALSPSHTRSADALI
jgi:hypothetical protein